MAQGKIRIPDLNMTGTPSNSTFLRGDGIWEVPAGAGDMSRSVYDTDNSGVVDNAEGISIVGRNATGDTLYKGTIVYLLLSTGNRPNFVKAQANSEATSSGTMGVISNDILNNADGNCCTIGYIDTLDTRSTATNPFTTDTLVDGDTIYLSPTTAGYITNVKPVAPNHLVYLGKVTRTSPTNGTIVYRVQNGYELEELHNVLINGSLANNEVLTYETSSLLWKPKSISTILGYTPYNGTTNLNAYTSNLGTVTSVSAGNGLSFTTITGTGPVTLGTPSSTTLSSTNAVTTTSHTHAFAPGGTTAQYITGAGTLVTFPTLGTWSTINYPTWASGTPFVKMTAAGAFALDTNTYLTSTTGVTTFSAGTTGFTPSTATSGAITLAGTLNVANGGTGSTAAAGARTNLGATTIGANIFTSTNPTAITFLRANADNTVSWLDAATFRTAIGAGTSTITPAALTKVDDTNVTLTLGVNAPTALLQATSITVGWTGTLADARIASASTWNAKQNALGFTPENVANKATDFTTVNNTLYPSVQAVKTYADALVAGLLDDRGSYNASVNTFPTTGGSGTAGAVLKGDFWYVSAAGTLGGVAVNIGDSFRALVDTPAQTAGNWSILEGNLGFVPYNSTNPNNYTANLGTVTSVATGSGLSGGTFTTTGTISLATAYGDTVNPYAPKTANTFLAAPNGAAGVPTFRAIVSADIPTLNQTTTGQAGSVAQALTITTGNGLNGTVGTYNGSAAVTISHLNTDGNLHVPATSTTNNGKFLMAGATAGALSWGIPTDTNTTYTFATGTTNGTFNYTPLGGSATAVSIFGLGSAAYTASTAYAAASHNQAWSTITSTPTTLSGYGITDAAPISGSAKYIQNQNASAQSANMWINGSGKFGSTSEISLGGASGDYLKFIHPTKNWSLYMDSGGFYIKNLTDTTYPFNILPSGAATFASSITSPEITLTNVDGYSAKHFLPAFGSTSDYYAFRVISPNSTYPQISFQQQINGTGGAITDVLTISSARNATFFGSVAASNGTLIGGTLTTGGYIPKSTGANSLGDSILRDNGGYVTLQTTNTPYLKITDGTGYVNIGIDTASGNGTFYNTSTYHKFLTNTGGVEAMRIIAGGNVGIGTTSPNTKLDVRGEIYSLNSNGSAPTVISNIGAPYYGSCIAMGADVGTAQGGTRLVSRYDANNKPAFTIETSTNTQGYGANPNLLTYSEVFRIANTGAATFVSTVTATGFFNSSDARLKDIISRDGDTVEFTWKDKRDNKKHIGYIAQEVQKTYPDQVSENENGMLSVNYIEVLVAKIQDLENRLKKLENGI